ncbi:MAG TPA: PKD domain-containing protein, partial [Pseudomonadales bacterium]|nr:PKD domain-containing protein [Pseudomonadales bacterium]
CAWLTNGASLVGFTLSGGIAQISEVNGGGVWCASSNAYVEDCVIISNGASAYGAGVYQGTITSCFIKGNNASGGAVYGAVLNNCTIVSNIQGGVYSPLAMTNCIIYFNNNIQNYSVSGTAFSHCCTTPALAGTGNFTNAPIFFTDGVHQANNSPCTGSGVSIGGGTDVFGNAYLNPPSVGCAEQPPMALVATPKITLTSNPVGFSIGNFAFAGTAPLSFSWLQNGQPLTDNGHFSGTQTSNLLASGVTFSDAGNYQVVASNASGSVTSAVATLVIHCVNIAGANPISPYPSWATAATNIQDAIAASASGDVVLVTNGLYSTGGISMDGMITNRVSINKPILVGSVNGAALTTIQGAWDPTNMVGPGAVRCVWMTNNTILSGFTICGGATCLGHAFTVTNEAGGVLGYSNSVVCNSVLTTNVSVYDGGGAYSITAIGCRFIGNRTYAPYSYIPGNGGGAERCNLQNCVLLGNSASQENASGGGADNCNLKNCMLIGNSAYVSGNAVNGGTLVNCTVISNSPVASNYEPTAVYGAALTNCIVVDNFSQSSTPANYLSCTLTYCCADPLPSGTGNVDVNPQLLGDGIHLAQTSPCIGASLSNVVSGTDIDGQPWNTPPSIGCDEWYAMPVIAIQPAFQTGLQVRGLTWNATVAGQAPFAYFWTRNGMPIQDDGHYSGFGTASPVINNFGPNDAGLYQLVTTNSSGSTTSAVVQLVIHAVDAAGVNPVPPYSSWANAATTIQDAINVAAPGDIVLVTNGIYASGGMVQSGGLTNRVMLNKPLTVTSVNGYRATTIQGAWDPVSTNGPSAIRCAWMGAGAVLNGFTLQNGATLAAGDFFQFESLESGGGVWGNATNAVVLDCVLTNNSAVYGGGSAWGTLDNSLIVGNQAVAGGGAGYSLLNNCTVLNNHLIGFGNGGGTYNAIVRNSIVLKNLTQSLATDNYYPNLGSGTPNFAYSCTYASTPSPPPGPGNTIQYPIFIDAFHISAESPCVGAGSIAYSAGYDLDGEPWNNPPSMGCDEIVFSNLVGPLSVNCSAYFTNILVSQPASFNFHYDTLFGIFQGHAAFLTWSFGDGPISSNVDATINHQWTNAGDYTVTFTAYNNDNPNGVSTNIVVHVQPALPVQMQSPVLSSSGFGFQFTGQMSANYIVQYTTNLNPPITWQQLQYIHSTNVGTFQILDTSVTNAARFYRVTTQ